MLFPLWSFHFSALKLTAIIQKTMTQNSHIYRYIFRIQRCGEHSSLYDTAAPPLCTINPLQTKKMFCKYIYWLGLTLSCTYVKEIYMNFNILIYWYLSFGMTVHLHLKIVEIEIVLSFSLLYFFCIFGFSIKTEGNNFFILVY